MKTVVIRNGEEHQFVAVAELPAPELLNPEQVLIKVLCVGLDGTDREIVTDNFGMLPQGEDHMIIGHELLGVVEQAGVRSGLIAGDLVTALVRRSCKDMSCSNCRSDRSDFCETGTYIERGIKEADGYLCEYVVEDAKYVVKVPKECAPYGVLVEPQSIVEKVWNQVELIQQRMIWQPKTALILGSGPLGILVAMTCRVLGMETYVWSKSDPQSLNADIIRRIGGHYRQAGDVSGASDKHVGSAAADKGADRFFTGLTAYAAELNLRFDMIWECSGYPPLGYESVPLLNNNGVLALLGVTTGTGRLDIPGDLLHQEMVMRNKCVIGSVNASRRDFITGIDRLRTIEQLYPGMLDLLFSKRIAIEAVPDLDFSAIAIKAVVDVVPPEQWNAMLNVLPD
jgi:threonine dehydrogenase-like Zn-dependent dehydrogenase